MLHRTDKIKFENGKYSFRFPIFLKAFRFLGSPFKEIDSVKDDSFIYYRGQYYSPFYYVVSCYTKRYFHYIFVWDLNPDPGGGRKILYQLRHRGQIVFIIETKIVF